MNTNLNTTKHGGSRPLATKNICTNSEPGFNIDPVPNVNSKYDINDQCWKIAVENTRDGFAIADCDGNILECNKAFCEMYDISRHLVIGENIRRLTTEYYIDFSYMDLVAKTGKEVTYKYTKKDGTDFVVTVIPVYDEEDKLNFYISQHRNLKEMKFYEPDILKDEDVQTYIDNGGSEPMVEFTGEKMQAVYELIDNMAAKNVNVLILGASGTGKSEIARRIHQNSLRKDGPFVTINCAVVPPNLIESELFGYLKGAFTGALTSGKRGIVETADGGTLFLDEIGEIPLELQSKLLQLTQEKTYTPIGGVKPQRVDARIIAATNKDIPELIAEKKFREDLYYRLAVVTVTMPPLKDRPEDIALLIKHFSNLFNLRHGTDTSFSREAVSLLCRYSWPGNIREIENLIEFLVLSNSDKYIKPYMLPSKILKELNYYAEMDKHAPHAGAGNESVLIDDIKSLDSFMQEQERYIIRTLYRKFDTSYKLASRLGISQSKANRLIRKYVDADTTE